MSALLVAAAVGWAVHRLLVRRPWPRRVPGPDVGAGPASPRRGRVEGGPSRPPGSSRRSGRRGRPWPSSHDGDAADLEACCDLLAVATSAGCSLLQAVDAVGAGGSGPVASALRGAAEDVVRGAGLVDAVERMGDRGGPGLRPLVGTLVVAAGAGTPVAPSLQRLADSERRRRRRAVEARIRRLPVLLLLPLVICILPAFVLMTLVPVGLASARSAVGPSADPVPAARRPSPERGPSNAPASPPPSVPTDRSHPGDPP